MTETGHSTRNTLPRAASRTYIAQGEFAIDGGDDAVISTLLGSCVSACIWDSEHRIGGMNHVLFTGSRANAAEIFGHGVNGMELLINGLLKRGVDRRHLRAKVFGGAKMMSGLSEEGERNSRFVLEYLAKEGIEYFGGDLGGRRARRVEFWPGTGRARMKYVKEDVTVRPATYPPSNTGVELF